MLTEFQLAGQRKREDGSELGPLSSFTGLRPSYW